MSFSPLHLISAYTLDLLVGDPPSWPHPIRWIGHFIASLERVFLDENAPADAQRLAGGIFWVAVVAGTAGAATLAIWGSRVLVHPLLGHLAAVWIAYTALATKSLHRESRAVAAALQDGDLDCARKRLSWIVSRDTGALSERDILRALVETVSENISDGIVAPLFYLALGGPVGAMAYKAVNTMDSMVGYANDRYRHFGWFAAKADDVANWVPARVSGLLIVAASVLLGMDWRGAWRIMWRDARKMKSPNAGFPEAAAAGALGVELGGTNIYFGKPVHKPTLGEPKGPLTLETYRSMVRLMFVTSLLACVMAVGMMVL